MAGLSKWVSHIVILFVVIQLLKLLIFESGCVTRGRGIGTTSML